MRGWDFGNEKLLGDGGVEKRKGFGSWRLGLRTDVWLKLYLDNPYPLPHLYPPHPKFQDQSIYICNSEMDQSEEAPENNSNQLMTQSLNLCLNSNKSINGRRKLYRRKMHRSASDTMNLSLNLRGNFVFVLSLQFC